MKNVEKITADDRHQVFIPDPRFGHHCLTTGPLDVRFDRRPTRCRVIAFNWPASPKVDFHSLN